MGLFELGEDGWLERGEQESPAGCGGCVVPDELFFQGAQLGEGEGVAAVRGVESDVGCPAREGGE